MRVFNNPDLYPTPEDVIETMVSGLNMNGKTVLEPSAGLGDIVDFCAGSGASVLACEIVPELREILNRKECQIIGENFLQVKSEQVSHVDYIIMNPPFSADEQHILHAWDIAPEGCTVVSLCNWATLDKYDHAMSRKILRQTIEDYGSAHNLEDVFSTAERKTNIEIGLVKLFKPKRKSETEFEGFFLEDEEEEQFSGLQQYNFVRDVVNRYVGAVKIFDQQLDAAQKMNALTNSFFSSNIALSLNQEGAEKSRADYKKELQKAAWKYVLNKFNLEKYATKGVREDINKFVETQQRFPFTMRNIYQMITIIVGTANNRMDDAMLEVFDALTCHYHDNRFLVEGWKTNSHYLVNEKFILPDLFGDPYSMRGGLKISHGRRNYDVFDDFMKALCYMTGKDYNRVPKLIDILRYDYVVYKDSKVVMAKNPHHDSYSVVGYDTRHAYTSSDAIQKSYPASEGYYYIPRPDHGEWFDFEFFSVKGFKKGTGHFKFKDRDVWALFNQHIARIKGFPLPEAVKPQAK